MTNLIQENIVQIFGVLSVLITGIFGLLKIRKPRAEREIANSTFVLQEVRRLYEMQKVNIASMTDQLNTVKKRNKEMGDLINKLKTKNYALEAENLSIKAENKRLLAQIA